jgi:IS5 family transposase
VWHPPYYVENAIRRFWIKMPHGKGCTREIKRDWCSYSEHLVSRGELLLRLSWVRSWDEELERMNEGKRGRPYAYPRSLVRFAELLRAALAVPLRELEGLLRALSHFLPLRAPDFSTLWHRLAREEVELEGLDLRRQGGFVIAVDSTGVKVSNRGEWMREKWKVHRGWIKVHLAVEVESGAIVGIAISDERAVDAQFLPDLVRQAQTVLPGPVKRVLADGAYDTRGNFDFLREEGIEAGIKIRLNASRKMKGASMARPIAVLERQRLGEEEWARRYEYNKRWRCETTFSAVKRMFGEAIMSRRTDMMLREATLKFVQYNTMLGADSGG